MFWKCMKNFINLVCQDQDFHRTLTKSEFCSTKKWSTTLPETSPIVNMNIRCEIVTFTLVSIIKCMGEYQF